MTVDLKFYETYFLWNDEGIDNALRWKYGYKKHLPLSNFDTSGYDGDAGFTSETLQQFYKFWNEPGPQNFNRVYGYQYIPENKNSIIYFHGNKNRDISDKIIECVKFKRDNNFYESEYFYTDIYKLENLGRIKDIEGGTLEIASQYGWNHALYHEIYNLKDYYRGIEYILDLWHEHSFFKDNEKKEVEIITCIHEKKKWYFSYVIVTCSIQL